MLVFTILFQLTRQFCETFLFHLSLSYLSSAFKGSGAVQVLLYIKLRGEMLALKEYYLSETGITAETYYYYCQEVGISKAWSTAKCEITECK